MNGLELVLIMLQLEKPLAPFLCEKLATVVKCVLEKPTRPEVLENSVCKIAEGRFTARSQRFTRK